MPKPEEEKTKTLALIDQYIIQTVVLLESLEDDKLKEPILERLKTIMILRDEAAKQILIEENLNHE
jgi:ADP-glucose pyrophosphorylase